MVGGIGDLDREIRIGGLLGEQRCGDAKQDGESGHPSHNNMGRCFALPPLNSGASALRMSGGADEGGTASKSS
jgi:hypothetical protein